MKTLSLIFAFMMTLTVTYAATTSNNAYEMLDEEMYINDIPFSTGDMVAGFQYEEAMNVVFNMEEETYVDDIPFDTECISVDCLYQTAMNQVFEMPEEDTITDIPSHLI